MAAMAFQDVPILIGQQSSVLVFPGIAFQADTAAHPLGESRTIRRRGASNRQQQLSQLGWLGMVPQPMQASPDLCFFEFTQVGLNLLEQVTDLC